MNGAAGGLKVGLTHLCIPGTHHGTLTCRTHLMNNPLMNAYAFVRRQTRVFEKGNFLSFED